MDDTNLETPRYVEILLSTSLSSKKISLNTLNLHRVIFDEINGWKLITILLSENILYFSKVLKPKK